MTAVIEKIKDSPKTECVLDYTGVKKVCSTHAEKPLFINFLRKAGLMKEQLNAMTIDELIHETLLKLKVDKESQIYEHPSFRQQVGGTASHKALMTHFRIVGPDLNDNLLDNFNIDDVLAQWAAIGCDKFKRKFYHIGFKMIDFKHTGPELYHLDLMDLINEGYDSFGVILNTDVSTGGGKHWFCIFGDLKHAGDDADPYTVEYFNSSANAPMIEVLEWLNKIKISTYKNHQKCVDIVYAAKKRLQHSRTECGVWALSYILNRLEGNPPDMFNQMNVSDQDMYHYRKFLFRS